MLSIFCLIKLDILCGFIYFIYYTKSNLKYQRQHGLVVSRALESDLYNCWFNLKTNLDRR